MLKSLFATVLAISLILGGIALAPFSSFAEAEGATRPLRVFESSAGGFRVSIPEAWHVNEIPKEEIYQVFFSREKVEIKGDVYTYGLSVLRLRDYRRAFQFEATAADSVALEYASLVASQLAGDKGGTVIGLPTGNHGARLSRFMVMGGEGEKCVSGQLLIGVSGKKWFHALWEVPCSEAKDTQMNDEITAMIKSLWVKKKWGGEAN